jgi:hypothetical protein
MLLRVYIYSSSSHFIHSFKMKSIDQSTSSRPLLIFKHYPKAGGGSIKKLLRQFKPNLYEQYHEQLLCSNLEKKKPTATTTTKQGSKNYTSSNIENECQAYIDFKDTLVVIPELFPVLHSDHDQGFVISSMREPCDHYLSLWSYGSTKTGYMYTTSYKTRRNWTIEAYGKEPPKFDSDRDIHAFKNIWLKDKTIKGLMSRRFVQSFGHEETPTSLQEMSNVVDCWVYIDDFQASLYACLKEYEDQGGYVDWDAPLVSALVEQVEAEQISNRNLKEHQEKNDPIGNPQLSHHSKCSLYFDQETADMVRFGSDSIIYDVFGYQHCCGRTRIFDNNRVTLPPAATTQHHNSIELTMKYSRMVNNTEQVHDERVYYLEKEHLSSSGLPGDDNTAFPSWMQDGQTMILIYIVAVLSLLLMNSRVWISWTRAKKRHE